MRQFIFEFRADFERLLQVFVFRVADSEFLASQRVIGLLNLLESLNLPLQRVNLGDGSVHRNLERFDGAFEALQETDLHHADKKSFAVGLGERVAGRRLIFRIELFFEVFRWVEEREFVATDFFVQFVVRKKSPLQINLRVNRERFKALRETSQPFDLVRVVFLDMLARPSDCEFVEELEKIRSQLGKQIARSPLARRLFGPVGKVGLGLAQRFFDALDADRVFE